MMHDRQRWSKSRTTKGLLRALPLSHQVTQHLFRKLNIGAEWTGFDHGRAIVSDSVCNMLDKEWACVSILFSRWLSETTSHTCIPGCSIGGTRPGEHRCCRSR